MNSGSDPTRPLLSKNDRNSTEHDGRKTRIPRRNSVNSLRSAFMSMLPDKVRSNLDSESPFDVDLSKATALSQGVKDYYEKQIATLKSFEEVDAVVDYKYTIK
ncbi:unnamed protein product [Lathyrus sativus]|nr:unnamed protein product [Lathyrus sativus]